MTAALSPGLSWLLVLLCVAVGAAVYVVVAGGRRYRRVERQWRNETRTFTEPEDAHIRIFGGPYDHETRQDFD